MLWWWLRQLRSSNSDTRVYAISALHKAGGKRVVAALIQALLDESPHVRSRAVTALDSVEPQWTTSEEFCTARPKFIECLFARSSDRRQAGVEMLGRFHDRQAADALIPLLKDGDSGVRWKVVKALANSGEAHALEALFAVSKDPDASIRHACVEALSTLTGARSIDCLTAALEDADEKVRSSALEGLARREAEALPALVHAFNTGSGLDRTAVAGVLERMGWQPADSSEAARYWVMLGRWDRAAELGPTALDALAAAASGADAHAATEALKAVGKIRDTRSIGILARALRQRHAPAHFRAEAVRALGEFSDPMACTPLIEVLRHPDYKSMRHVIIRSLIKIGDPRAAQSLGEAFRSGDGANNPDIVAALAGWGEAGIDQLVKSVGQAPGLVIPALVEIGEASVEPLKRAVSGSNSRVTQAALDALDQLGYRPGSVHEQIRYALARKDWKSIEELCRNRDDVLAGLLKNKDRLVRNQALDLLNRIKPDWPDSAKLAPLAFRLLLEDLAVRHEPTREEARQRLLSTGEAGVDFLIEALRREDLKEEVANTLRQMKATRAVPALVAELRAIFGTRDGPHVESRDEAYLRRALEGALIAAGEPAIESVVPLLQESFGMRREAARILGGIGSVRALSPLTRATRDRGTGGDALHAIREILSRENPSRISSDDLKAVERIGRVTSLQPNCDSDGNWFGDEQVEVNSSETRELARQELLRRGLWT